jgi:hypothetical protein
MDARSMLVFLLTWVLYPVWLVAGAVDYFCHRATDIEHTSGALESWLHVGQFLCISVALALVVSLELTWPVMVAAAVALLTHSALAYVDVTYTDARRRITPLEQQVHGYMEVIPLVSLCLVAIVHWDQLASLAHGQPVWRLRAEPIESNQRLWLLGSFVVLAGLPIGEELLRTLRRRSRPAAAEV